MKALFLSVLFSISAPLAATSYDWPWPEADSPYVTGMQAMLDAIRDKDGENGWRSRHYDRRAGRYNPWTGRYRSPFPDDDPWAESGIPYDELPESRFKAFIKPSPSSLLRGRWVGQAGDGLWIQHGWVRFYKGDDYVDARIIIKKDVFYAGFPSTGRVKRFYYQRHEDLLAIEDYYGQRYYYQKFEEKEYDDSSDKQSDSDDD